MSKVADAIRDHQRALLENLRERVTRLVEKGRTSERHKLATFLTQELLPHAMWEERHLYPEVEPLLIKHGSSTKTMSVDHEFIQRYVHDIEQTVRALDVAESDESLSVRQQLERLTLQLQAVLELHLEKEERVYLPLFESHLSDDQQRRVLEGMHSAYEDCSHQHESCSRDQSTL